MTPTLFVCVRCGALARDRNFLKHKFRSQAEYSADADFQEALYENDSARRSADRQAQRKTWQFCKQVQRALNLALCDLGSGLFVEGVSPAPDCGRLLVHVLMAPGAEVEAAMADLRDNTSRLRAEVARAITRKRAPELAFVPVLPEGALDE